MRLEHGARSVRRRFLGPLALASAAALLPSYSGGDAPEDGGDELSPLAGLTTAQIAAAPIDYGPGPGMGHARPAGNRSTRLAAGRLPSAASPSVSDPDLHLTGAFGPAFEWPLIPLHQVLLPDGRIMTFGTDLRGKQGAALYYAVWDPALGSSPDAFLVLDNVTRTDIFCATQLLMPGSGEVAIFGGDRLDLYGRRNNGNADVTFFNFLGNTIRKDPVSMAWRRWYATAVTTGDGEIVVMGGHDDAPLPAKGGKPAQVATYAPTPEVYTPGVGWRSLTNAASDAAYGAEASAWNYPRAWLAPDGSVFVLPQSGKTFRLNPGGSGTLLKYAARTASGGALPSAMFAPGKILSLRKGLVTVVIDINAGTPTIAPTTPPSQDRTYAGATLLPDGRVFVNGGSSTGNTLGGAAYHSELWDPVSGAWTVGPSATKPRLYHSASILLPDGSVLTGGGGAPGPVKNLNAELYFPGYLFEPGGSGAFATRPSLVGNVPAQLGGGQSFTIAVSNSTAVSRVVLMRTGSVTHALNNEQRIVELPVSQQGNILYLQAPSDRFVAPPGYYMLFVFDADGVPAVAPIIRLFHP